MQETEATRSEQASDTGNSKLVTSRSCPGFPVNSYEPITCSLNGKQLVVNPQEGTFLFITDWQSFTIPTDVTIVNIENMEKFRFIRQQKALFTSTHAPQTSQMLRSGRIYCGGYGPKKTNTHLTEHEKQEKRLST